MGGGDADTELRVSIGLERCLIPVQLHSIFEGERCQRRGSLR